MLVWAWEGISDSAKAVIEAAGHTVAAGPGVPLSDYPFVMWTRLEPVRGGWRPSIVATPCTDSSHCDEARQSGARVLSLRDVSPQDMQSVRATVEHTLALILALTRHIPSAVESVRRGEWDRMRFQGTDIYLKRALIVGKGRIGEKVEDLLRALGMFVSWVDTKYPESLDWMSDRMREADLITVHVSLNETSRGMFGREQFAAMKPGALFINTSRGAVVDEAALLEALESGHLGGAALDVLCEEPPKPDNPLLEFARREPERLLISPHLGGCTVESLEKAETLLARKLCEVLAGA